MERIGHLLELIKSSPTILDPEDEMEFAKFLMETPDSELIEARAEVRFILRELSISHVDNGFMLLDPSNQYSVFFRDFHRWLTASNSVLTLGVQPHVLAEFGSTREDAERYCR